jgi:hypothetical protein
MLIPTIRRPDVSLWRAELDANQPSSLALAGYPAELEGKHDLHETHDDTGMAEICTGWGRAGRAPASSLISCAVGKR